MAGQNGLNLADDIIAAHFGDIVAKVCSRLLHRGTLPLQELLRFTELSASQAKNCLLVLIQHNCVQAFSTPRPSSAGDKTVTQYMALFDNILHRMRFPKFLGIVKADLDHQAEALLEGLLQNGRLTFEQLVERTISKATQDNAPARQELLVTFNRLVHSHYVERCPKPEPFLDPNPEDQSMSARKRLKTFEPIVTLEHQATTAASLSDAERFSVIPENLAEMSDTKVAGHQSVASGKRKYETLEMDQELQATIAENEFLWRANYEKFMCCLMKKVCAENVRSRLGLDASVVLEAIIEASGEEKIKSSNSVTTSMSSILERLRAKPGGISMTLEHIRATLDQLHCRSSPSTENSGELYTIDLSNIIDASQNNEIDSLVKSRYGQEAYRIFRLLIKSGHPFETDRIAEVTFVEKKNAQEILYKLWKDEYLEMEKVLSQGPGQVQLFVWKLKKKALYEHILEDIYHAAFNLSQKIAQITEHQLEAPKDTEKKLLDRKIRLQLCLLKLDDSIMLFHDFCTP